MQHWSPANSSEIISPKLNVLNPFSETITPSSSALAEEMKVLAQALLPHKVSVLLLPFPEKMISMKITSALPPTTELTVNQQSVAMSPMDAVWERRPTNSKVTSYTEIELSEVRMAQLLKLPKDASKLPLLQPLVSVASEPQHHASNWKFAHQHDHNDIELHTAE